MDGVFLQHLDPDSPGGSVAEAIVRLAEGLQLLVVAEWVEHDAQREWLRRIGCDMIQGFAVGEPRPAGELELPETAADQAS